MGHVQAVKRDLCPLYDVVWGAWESSSAGGRPFQTYLGPIDSLFRPAAPALDRPNHLSTYLLGPLQ